MSNVFVSGARGFVGSRLVEALLKDGHNVHALIRPNTQLPPTIKNNKNIQVFEGDITNIKDLIKATAGCEQAYHLAALAKPWSKNMTDFETVNVTGTKNVLEACLKNDTNQIVITSSAGMLGPQQSEQLITENQIPTSWFSEYERTKWKSVELAKTYLNKGLKVRIVSPTRVFGPGELSTSNAVTMLISDYIKGNFRFVPGNGHGIGNYVFISDVVRGHIQAMKNGKAGENYILGGSNLSYRAFFDTVGELIEFKYRLFNTPIKLMLIAAHIMETTANLTGKAPLITPPFVRKYTHNWGTDLSKAQQEIDYRITPIQEALNQTIQWIKSQQKLR